MKMFKRQSNVHDEGNGEVIDNLLASVKRQVKQIMEEAVTKKFIHEDSSSIITLCGAVELCLQHKLKKHSVSQLFTNSSPTTVLLHKVAKTLDEAKPTSKAVSELESQHDTLSRFSLKSLSLEGNHTPPNQHHMYTNGHLKYAWIRIALINKVLASIVSFLVTNNSKYYEPKALMADQAKGSLFAQLLEGPCALEYSRMKTSDHLYTDPNADELVLRHKLHSSASIASQTSLASPQKRPALALGRARCSTSSSSEDSMRSVPIHAREYVESLHQNHKANLLYGKNNVKVLPRDGDEPLPGYLSLHQTYEELSLKWTPNQLMNSNKCSTEQLHTHIEEEATCIVPPPSANELMWDCAINVNIDEIVYLHCHHQGSCGGTLILVGVDGVQSPAFHFPFGGHLLAFLTCLESGLQPHSHLDPPLWIHKDTGKIFPKLKKRFSSQSKSTNEGGDSTNPYSSTPASYADVDYVFRIGMSYKPKSIHDLIDPGRLNLPGLNALKSFRLPWSSSSKTKSPSLESQDSCSGMEPTSPHWDEEVPTKPPLQTRNSLQKLCETMKLRILSRAFYGWLAHCRHLKTVREHLSGLVYTGEAVLPAAPAENEKSLTEQFWNGLTDNDKEIRKADIYRRVYYGGVSHDIRKQVWPYLLGHYPFGSTKEDRLKVDMVASRNYENTRTEWTTIEDVLKQREQLQRCNGEINGNCNGDINGACDGEIRGVEGQSVPSSTTADTPLPDNFRSRLFDRQFSTLSNEVFLDTVIVAELDSEEFTTSTRPHPPLTKWHTVDSNYREDYCSVKVSHSYGGFRRIGSFDAGCVDGVDSPQSEELLEAVEKYLHEIDKDVHRCDRSYWYFTENNLKKLRNVMCTYVWKNLHVGYIQGMCDLVAPLLVIFDDESITYSCFTHLMKRMVENFPSVSGGKAMNAHTSNMRSLMRVLDPELYDLIHHYGDYTTEFCFCFRWLLLDFKREMCYNDVFLVWESIWAAEMVCSENYVAFIALAMIEEYRDILLDNNMDLTDVLKFFNEMAEKHNAKEILCGARDLVFKLQNLVENK